jgi:hypothetical protein
LLFHKGTEKIEKYAKNTKKDLCNILDFSEKICYNGTIIKSDWGDMPSSNPKCAAKKQENCGMDSKTGGIT